MFSIDFRPNGGRGATDFNFSGSITLVIPSLTTLQSQLEEDCRKFGFTVVNLNKVVRHGCTADLVPCTLYLVRNRRKSSVNPNRGHHRSDSAMMTNFQVSEDKMQDALTHRPQVVLANVDILATDLIQVQANY